MVHQWKPQTEDEEEPSGHEEPEQRADLPARQKIETVFSQQRENFDPKERTGGDEQKGREPNLNKRLLVVPIARVSGGG
jgi:hypothetical protein